MDGGGRIVDVSGPLSIVTIEAGRELIERLADSEAVASIMENQPIDTIDTLRDD